MCSSAYLTNGRATSWCADGQYFIKPILEMAVQHYPGQSYIQRADVTRHTGLLVSACMMQASLLVTAPIAFHFLLMVFTITRSCDKCSSCEILEEDSFDLGSGSNLSCLRLSLPTAIRLREMYLILPAAIFYLPLLSILNFVYNPISPTYI